MITYKINPIMEECRKLITPEIKKQVDLCVAIANRVYDLLEERGMSQYDLACALGETETEVSGWLSGTQNLTIDKIAKMATVLNDDIISTTSSKKPQTKNIDQMAAEDNMTYEKRKPTTNRTK